MTDFGVRISEVILSEISGSVHAWMLVLKTCLGEGCAPWSIWVNCLTTKCDNTSHWRG